MFRLPKPPLSTLSLALLLASSGIAQAKTTPAKGRQSEIAKLHALLDRIEKAMKSFIAPERVEERLRARTPSFRTFRVAGKATTAPAVQPGEEKKPEKNSRILGDEEKKALPKGTVLVVEGQPVLESEVNELAKYFAGYRPGTDEERAALATGELIKIRTVQSAFKDKLPELKKRAEELRQAATAKGGDFGKVASEHSDCPSGKAQQGSLGEFGRDQMVPSFSRWAFDLGIGKVSPVFATHFGYHFIKVTGKQNVDNAAQAMVSASHVLVTYTKNESQLHALSQKAEAGQSDVAVISDEWRKKLPPVYR